MALVSVSLSQHQQVAIAPHLSVYSVSLLILNIILSTHNGTQLAFNTDLMNIRIPILQVENSECFNSMFNTVQFSWNWELNQIYLIPKSMLFSPLPSKGRSLCRCLFTHAQGINTSEGPSIVIFVLYFSDKYNMLFQSFINKYK